jgi:ribulose-bisphosphate carboxylase large chain
MALEPMGAIRPALPAPAGGMSFERIGDTRSTYGADVIYLIGGALVSHSDDLVANCRRFRELVERG